MTVIGFRHAGFVRPLAVALIALFLVPTVGRASDVTPPVAGADNVGHAVSVAHPYNVSFGVCVLYDQTKVHKAGSAVPIKLALCDASQANVSAPSIVLTATGVTQVSTGAPGVLEDAGSANPGDRLRYDASLGGYIFNLKTTGFHTGTYALTFTATGDPIPHEVRFQIR